MKWACSWGLRQTQIIQSWSCNHTCFWFSSHYFRLKQTWGHEECWLTLIFVASFGISSSGATWEKQDRSELDLMCPSTSTSEKPLKAALRLFGLGHKTYQIHLMWNNVHWTESENIGLCNTCLTFDSLHYWTPKLPDLCSHLPERSETNTELLMGTPHAARLAQKPHLMLSSTGKACFSGSTCSLILSVYF